MSEARRSSSKNCRFLLIPVSCAITLAAQTSGTMTEIAPAPLALRVANALLAYVSYLGQAIFPFFLGVLYPFQTNVNLPSVGAVAAILLGITFVALRLRRRFPFLVIGWLWFLGTLVPMIGLVKVGRQQMADRYAYIPFIGLYIAIVWSAAALIASRKLKLSLAAVALAFYAARVCSSGLLAGWPDAGTTHVRRHKGQLLLSFPVGAELEGVGRLDDAIEALREGVRVAPHEAETYIRLGNLLIRTGATRRRLALIAARWRTAKIPSTRVPDWLGLICRKKTTPTPNGNLPEPWKSIRDWQICTFPWPTCAG